MAYDLLTALALFAFVSSITPGPNNLMLMASGANFGLRKTVPHMLGVALGFVFMVLLIGIGLIQVFDAFPASYIILKICSVAYLLYLAWRISVAAPATPGSGRGRPITFLQAAAFQWVNPKAWAMALTAFSVYAPDQSIAAAFLVAAVFGAVNLPSVASWAFLGQKMTRFLTKPARLVTFNRIMAGLLILSLFPVLWT